MRSDPLLIGCAAGIAYTRGLLPRRLVAASTRRALWPAAVLAAAAVACAESFWPVWGHVAGLPVFELAVAVVIVTVLLDERALCTRVLTLRPLVFTGEISYSLYIWHGLFLAFAAGSWIGGLPALPLGFAVAIASRRLIELPFLRKKVGYARSERVEAQPLPAPA